MTEPTYSANARADDDVEHLMEMARLWFDLERPEQFERILRRELVRIWEDGRFAADLARSLNAPPEPNPWRSRRPAAPAAGGSSETPDESDAIS